MRFIADCCHSMAGCLGGARKNNIGFIDNWTSFWGRPDLLKRDGLHPSWGGAALLSRNMAHSVRIGDEGMRRGLTNAGEWALLNNIKQNSNKNYPVGEKQFSWQALAGQGTTKQGRNRKHLMTN